MYNLQSHPLPCNAACDPRQEAEAFNQPLSWDTSSVTSMSAIFYVRCCSAPPPICSRPFSPACCVHAAIARRLPPPGPQSPRPAAMSPACDPRQDAEAFNQPLSWDTSRVMAMHWMFSVRCSSPRPATPNLYSSHVCPSSCTRCVHTLRDHPPPPASGPHSPPHTVCPACDTRQDARAFNQPLSWDISSVTYMVSMFAVRCSPRPAPNLQSLALSPARCVHRNRARCIHPREAPRLRRISCTVRPHTSQIEPLYSLLIYSNYVPVGTRKVRIFVWHHKK